MTIKPTLPDGAKTLGELRQEISELPAEWNDFIVVQSRDPEGNGFELFGQLTVGYYRNDDGDRCFSFGRDEGENWVEVFEQATSEYLNELRQRADDDEPVQIDDDDIPAICLWP